MPLIRWIINSIAGAYNSNEPPAPTKRDETADVEAGKHPSGQAPPEAAQHADNNAQEEEEYVPKWKNEGFVHLIIMAALPPLFFNVCSRQGRQDYVNMLFESRIQQVVSWLPFIIVNALASVHERLAIWLAFGIMALIVSLEYYHHTYKPVYPALYWFNTFLLVTLLGLGVALEIRPYSNELITPVTVSSLALATLCSLAVRQPFTLQFARPQVPPAFAATPLFLDMNYFLTFIWVVLFAIILAAAWCGYLLDGLSDAGKIILSTVIPIAVPILGIPLMPILGQWHMKRQILNMPEAEREQYLGAMAPEKRAKMGL